jgi:hypothetical protein
VNIFFMHEQLVGGAIIERVVKALDADAGAWRKAKGFIDVPKISGACVNSVGLKGQASEEAR